MKTWIGAGVAFVLLAVAIIFWAIPVYVDGKMNGVERVDGPYDISAQARELHASLRVVDLHSDMTLWMRDPAKRHNRGQTDFPRLREGGFALQVFSATTKAPKDMNYETNSADSDNITLVAKLQRWPVRTWDSLFERAKYQVDRLSKLEKRDRFILVRTKGDLERALNENILAGLFLIEGGHPLEGEIENLDRLYDAGLRIVGLQHFFDNELGGSLHGLSGAGLTDFGRAVIARADEKSMMIDVAHSSEQVVRDVLAMTDRPLMVSHTGFSGHCRSPRNISDELMKEIAAAGGLIGVGFWADVTCGPRVGNIAEAIIYGVELVGVDHIALGSDFDGTVITPIDASEVVAITEALMARGMDQATIRAVMGENAIRFFRENLPD